MQSLLLSLTHFSVAKQHKKCVNVINIDAIDVDQVSYFASNICILIQKPTKNGNLDGRSQR